MNAFTIWLNAALTKNFPYRAPMGNNFVSVIGNSTNENICSNDELCGIIVMSDTGKAYYVDKAEVPK